MNGFVIGILFAAVIALKSRALWSLVRRNWDTDLPVASVQIRFDKIIENHGKHNSQEI